MKRRSQLLLVTLATLALVFAYGCSDDDTGGSSGNNGGATPA